MFNSRNIFFFFCVFSAGCFSPSEDEVRQEKLKKRETRLAVQPFGKMDTTYINVSVDALKDHYPISVTILSHHVLPEECRSPYAKTRFRADSLLHWMRENVDLQYDYVLGLTDVDITATKNKEPPWKYRDWGIFGLGSCPGRTCVVSVFRLGSRNASEQLKKERLRKVVLHEVGHTFGLQHCPDKHCLMADAVETIVTVDNEKEELCGKCKNQLGFY